MASDFFYFISSLPLLRFGEKAALTYDTFLNNSRDCLSEQEAVVLGSLKLCPPKQAVSALPVIEQWYSEETYLRNLVSGYRTRSRKLDAGRWQRESSEYSAPLIKRIEEIMALPNAWEKEQALDLIRWQRLDELGAGHLFDFPAVIVYALRLLILDKQRRRDEEAGSRFAAELVEAGLGQAAKQRVDVE